MHHTRNHTPTKLSLHVRNLTSRRLSKISYEENSLSIKINYRSKAPKSKLCARDAERWEVADRTPTRATRARRASARVCACARVPAALSARSRRAARGLSSPPRRRTNALGPRAGFSRCRCSVLSCGSYSDGPGLTAQGQVPSLVLSSSRTASRL